MNAHDTITLLLILLCIIRLHWCEREIRNLKGKETPEQ